VNEARRNDRHAQLIAGFLRKPSEMVRTAFFLPA
jgi:hypothetical protein